MLSYSNRRVASTLLLLLLLAIQGCTLIQQMVCFARHGKPYNFNSLAQGPLRMPQMLF